MSNKNRFYNYKLKIRLKLHKARMFYHAHKEPILAISPVVIGGGIKLVRYLAKQNTIKKKKDVKDRYIYDRSEGHYWELRRPLRSDEWTYISRQRNYGRKYADILSELGVLK